MPAGCWRLHGPPRLRGQPPGRLALAAAQTAVHHDFRTAGPRWAPDAISAAEAVTGPQDRWRLDFLEVQHDYGRELIGEDGTPRFGPDGHDPARLAALAQRAEALLHRRRTRPARAGPRSIAG